MNPIFGVFLLLFISVQGCSAITQLLKFAKSGIFTNLEKIDISKECRADVMSFMESLQKKEMWTLRMIDANTKLGAAMSRGNVRLLGNFDQCLAIKEAVDSREITGKYCTFGINHQRNMTHYVYNMLKKSNNLLKISEHDYYLMIFPSWGGSCVPKTCSSRDLNKIWAYIRKKFELPLDLNFQDEKCSYKNRPVLSNPVDIYVFTFFGLVFLLVIVSTIYEIYLLRVKEVKNTIVPFSLYSNGKNLLSTHCNNENLSCMHGIRVISMLWILTGHVIFAELLSPHKNHLQIFSAKENNIPIKVLLHSATLAVDTFFTMSGLLVVYFYFKYSEKYNIFILFYLFRILRLLPALLAVVLFQITIAKYLTDGPLWFGVIRNLAANCEERGWATLSFLSNFIPVFNICIGQSWYLSCDTQFYVTVPILIYGFKKYPSKTFLGVVCLCLLSFLYTAITVMVYKLGFLVLFEVKNEELVLIYQHPLARLPAWLVGACFGYFLYKNNLNLSKEIHTTILAGSLTVMISLVLYHRVLLTEEFSLLRSVYMNCFSRPLWAIAVCSIIYTCFCGHGGFINRFLSHPVFIILGKLSYSIFLTQGTVLQLQINNRNFISYFNPIEIFFSTCGCIVNTIIVSVLLTLFFESPVLSLIKCLRGRRSQQFAKWD